MIVHLFSHGLVGYSLFLTLVKCFEHEEREHLSKYAKKLLGKVSDLNDKRHGNVRDLSEIKTAIVM